MRAPINSIPNGRCVMERKRFVTGDTSGAVLDVQGSTEKQCLHYWVIDSPNGQISSGVCKICGVTKEFDNWGPDSVKYGDISDALAPSIPDLVGMGDKEGVNDTLIGCL